MFYQLWANNFVGDLVNNFFTYR